MGKSPARIAAILFIIAIPLAAALVCFEPRGKELPYSFPERLNCAIALNDGDNSFHGLVSGYNYLLLNRFCEENGTIAAVRIPEDGADYLDSLRAGSVDLVVVPAVNGTKDSLVFSETMDEGIRWAARSVDSGLIEKVDGWFSTFRESGEYPELRKSYLETFNNPFNVASLGRTRDNLSPYDGLIRQYADSLGWDWRMLAAVVYQESKFRIEARSGRGAVGLMQLLPSTAQWHSMDTDALLDPEENIAAGVRYLRRLLRMFRNRADGEDNVRRFALAAYNAGEGHILDCINFANWLHMPLNTWDDLVSVFPTMADDMVLQIDTVKLGKFKAEQTEEYVTNIYDLYDAFCAICPQ